MVVDSNFYINLALNEAWKYQGFTYPNPAVGCCIVGKHGQLLSVEAHKKAGEPHAEVLGLQTSYYKLTNDSRVLKLSKSSDIHTFLLKNHNGCFSGITLYTTLEPCSHIGKTPSCASLISNLNIKKVIVGSLDSNKEASNGNAILKDSGIVVEDGVMQKECDELLRPFNKFIESSFVFFKWAQRIDGSTDNGIISSKESRKDVHSMRDVCDLLVIGGNTVRVDRPTLDSRLVNGKAPDILIISKTKKFDESIPLFGIKGREVFIADNFEMIKNYKNIMIEGSSKMFELTRDIVDYYLCYLAPSFGGVDGFKNIEDKFEILNIQKETQDIIMWMKRRK
jgi:diaminohydroxyphosphoribosylaminopyrimidine deaminase/5-amino-6-(5-phosphoribosylamino)uracil reductase